MILVYSHSYSSIDPARYCKNLKVALRPYMTFNSIDPLPIVRFGDVLCSKLAREGEGHLDRCPAEKHQNSRKPRLIII